MFNYIYTIINLEFMIELTKDQKETYLNNEAINYHTEKISEYYWP